MELEQLASAMQIPNGPRESGGKDISDANPGVALAIKYRTAQIRRIKDRLTQVLDRLQLQLSNTDDHLRNHAFLYEGQGGWRLSPAYDLNPVPVDIKPRVLVTAITEDDNTASLALAFEVAGYFEIAETRARAIAAEVAAVVRTFQPGRSVDDAFEAAVAFTGGAVGTIEATRFAAGRKNAFRWEINGANGSIAFDLERPNELQVSEGGEGFRTLLVTQPDHPFIGWWWPPGHVIGWEHTFVHELEHLLGAIAGRNAVAPHGATFEDGYRAAEVCDAIVRSAESGRREAVSFREAT